LLAKCKKLHKLTVTHLLLLQGLLLSSKLQYYNP
jgi:hypothetical protein